MHPTCVLSRHQRGCFFRRGTKELIYCRFKSLVWLNLLLSNYTYIYIHILIQMINTIYANNIYIYESYIHTAYIYIMILAVLYVYDICVHYLFCLLHPSGQAASLIHRSKGRQRRHGAWCCGHDQRRRGAGRRGLWRALDSTKWWGFLSRSQIYTGEWGPCSIAWSVAWTKWLNSMVYGRYNELVHGGYNGL